MNSSLRLTAAAATLVAIGSVAGTAVAQPNSDIYAYPTTEPAFAIATAPVTVTRAPTPGIVVAYREIGPAATGLTSDRPTVVAAPQTHRGYVQSAGHALAVTGLVAGD
jgi:hypothetical protein